MLTLFKNIKQLIQVREANVLKVVGKEMNVLPIIENAFLIVNNNLIEDFGKMQHCPKYNFDAVVDVSEKLILPSWCDSHTHLVFAGNRSNEFVDRIKGLTYEEIAGKGGGILNSAKLLNETSEIDLYSQSEIRLKEIILQGTGAVEIKSGYGLTVEGELKMLRVIKKLAQNYPISIKSTFLGAHAFPKEFKNNKEGYIDLICNQMLPKIHHENLANFVDVFLETNYFDCQQTEKIINKAKEFNLIPKIHVNQFTAINGVETAVKLNALSVDHLEIVTNYDIECLQNSNTMPVALPGCSFFIGIPYTPAKKIIEANLPLAIASDFNPGTTPSGNMNFMVSLACIKMKMTPEQAINAATLNGAYAMQLASDLGSITKGKKANFNITKALNSYNDLPYLFGSNSIESVYLEGVLQ